MSEGAALPAATPHDLGPLLEPALVKACGGRISDIHWFRADWQRGGAATAFASAHGLDDTPRDVVVKFPLGWREYRALTLLDQAQCGVTPRVVHHGVELGGYDLAWVVMERLPGHTLRDGIGKAGIVSLAEAAADFYHSAREAWPLDTPPDPVDWEGLLARARDGVRDNSVESEQVWVNAIKRLNRGLVRWVAEWRQRPRDIWCHGDLHPGNAMRRADGSAWGASGVVLLDFAEMHVGHWVEDAVYLERLFWANPGAIGGAKPVSLMARAMRKRGFELGEGYARLALIRRALIAGCVPAFMHREGHPAYLRAALEVLTRSLDELEAN